MLSGHAKPGAVSGGVANTCRITPAILCEEYQFARCTDILESATALHDLVISHGDYPYECLPRLHEILSVGSLSRLKSIEFPSTLVHERMTTQAIGRLLAVNSSTLQLLQVPRGAPEGNDPATDALIDGIGKTQIKGLNTVTVGSYQSLTVERENREWMQALGDCLDARTLQAIHCTADGPIYEMVRRIAGLQSIEGRSFRRAGGGDCHFWHAVRDCPTLRCVTWAIPLAADAEGQAALREVLAAHQGIEELKLEAALNVGPVPVACYGAVADGLLANRSSRLAKLSVLQAVAGEDQRHLGRIVAGGATGLRELHVSCCMGETPMRSLSEGLRAPACRLRVLGLRRAFGPSQQQGWDCLGEALGGNTSLRRLEIGVYCHDGHSMEAVGRGFAQNVGLEEVHVFLDPFLEHQRSQLLRGMRENLTIRRLDIEADTDGGARYCHEEFAELLERSVSLERISRIAMPLDNRDLVCLRIGRALEVHRGLQYIELSLRNSTEDWVHLQRMIAKNRCLQFVRLRLLKDLPPEAVRAIAATIRERAPGLRQVTDGRFNIPGLQEALEADRTHVVRAWLRKAPTGPRAACALRMLPGPHGAQLPAQEVCEYAAGALRRSLEAKSVGGCVVVVSAVVDGMSRQSESGREQLGFLRSHRVREGSGLWQAAEAVVKEYGGNCGTVGTAAIPHGFGRKWSGVVMQCEAVVRAEMDSRAMSMLLWDRARRAHRDASRVFRAAAEGRPLELRMRLVLGAKAGGLNMRGKVTTGGQGGKDFYLSPLEAARIAGHLECVGILEAARGDAPDLPVGDVL